MFILKPSFPLLVLPSVTSMLFSLLCNLLVQKDFKWNSNVIVTDKQIQKPSSQHQHGIFLHNWVALGILLFFWEGRGCSLYSLQMVVTWWKSREISSLWNTQNCSSSGTDHHIHHAQSHLNSLSSPFLMLALNFGEPSSPSRRNELDCCHVIG